MHELFYMGGFMETIFLLKEYAALSLIKSKNYFFCENFITISELNQFVHFLQQEFNNRNLNVVITSNTLSIDDFTVMGEVIMVSNNCCFNLDLLPIDVSKILYDSNLIGNFLQHLENEKLETLEIKKKVVPKLYKK